MNRDDFRHAMRDTAQRLATTAGLADAAIIVTVVDSSGVSADLVLCQEFSRTDLVGQIVRSVTSLSGELGSLFRASPRRSS